MGKRAGYERFLALAKRLQEHGFQPRCIHPHGRQVERPAPRNFWTLVDGLHRLPHLLQCGCVRKLDVQGHPWIACFDVFWHRAPDVRQAAALTFPDQGASVRASRQARARVFWNRMNLARPKQLNSPA